MSAIPLKLFNTQSRTVEALSISNGSFLRIYSCGPTVYRDAHVGNLRTFLLTDLIVKVLNYIGTDVRLVQNITDVGHMSEDLHEDKILSESSRRKLDPFEIAREYEKRFHNDLALLGVTPADEYPRASESIEMMQDVISKLIADGYSYVGSDSSVYFDARSYDGYGELSGNRLDALKPGHRYDYVDDGAKRFHADWSLWKSAGSRSEMIWDSPWGSGFPGWHIECSAMSLHYLDGAVDLHLGGIDLRFPHHENERAQSNCVAGKEVVSHWVHGEHLLFEGRKMSKSAGNVVLVSDIIARGLDPLALRLIFLENRYRSQIDLTWDSLAAADSTIARWRMKLRSWGNPSPTPHSEALISKLVDYFLDDLASSDAMVELRRIERDENISEGERAHIFIEIDRILSLDLRKKEETFELTTLQSSLLEARVAARAAKDFQESDRLRNELRELGIEVKDSPSGQSYDLIQ